MTAHTIETAQPSVRTWGKKLIIFPVLPKDPEEETDLNTQTQKAAAALKSAEYDARSSSSFGSTGTSPMPS